MSMKGEKSDNFHANMFLKLESDLRPESIFKYILALERKILWYHKNSFGLAEKVF